MCTVKDNVGYCAIGDKKSELVFPDQMVGFKCWTFPSQMLLGERLAECEANDRLPSNDNTWRDMQVCEIYGDAFIKIPCKRSEMESLVCSDPEGADKIYQKLLWCARR